MQFGLNHRQKQPTPNYSRPPPLQILTVIHKGIAIPVVVIRGHFEAVIPQRGLAHIRLRLRFQPAPASQGNDAQDDGQAQEQGQEPSAPPAGQAAPDHFVCAEERRGKSEGSFPDLVLLMCGTGVSQRLAF